MDLGKTKTRSLHAMRLQVSLSPGPDVGHVGACPVSTVGPGGTHSQSQHWGAVMCQKAQPRGSLTSPRDLHSNIPDPEKNNKSPYHDTLG